MSNNTTLQQLTKYKKLYEDKAESVEILRRKVKELEKRLKEVETNYKTLLELAKK